MAGREAAMPRMRRLFSLLAGFSLSELGALARASPAKVHVVYMTHLDIGFTDTSRNVCDLYFEIFFPRALQTAAELRRNCSAASAATGRSCPAFRWTQFPWLVAEYLDGLAGCAHRQRTPAEVARLEEAIARDDIVWHANPLNELTELADAGLWDFGLKMRSRLNSKYGKRHGRAAGKLSDVTGMSRGAIPWLVRNGVRAMHIGYNGVGGLPIVMPNGSAFSRGASFCGYDSGCPSEAVFLWREPTTQAQIVMMIEDNYGTEIDVPLLTRSRTSMLQSKATPGHVLILHYTQDNGGTPSAQEVQALWSSLEGRFPAAKITLSTLDDFYEEAFGGGTEARLPLVTAELGDSWLYGGAADPMKLATFREARRSLTEAVAAREVDAAWWQYESYMRRLLKGPPEHNWGMSTGSVCADCRLNSTAAFGSTWTNTAFARARYSAEYQRYDCPAGFSPGSARWGRSIGVCGYGPMEQEWAEQREWMHPLPSWSALRGWDRADLSNQAAWEDFVHRLEGRLLPLRAPKDPDVSAMTPVRLPRRASHCGHVRGFGLDLHGAIDWLDDGQGGSWADADHVLGKLRYVTYSRDDFTEFAREWNNHDGDFSKPGMETADPESRTWSPLVSGAFESSDSSSRCRFVVQYAMPREAHEKYGAPERFSVSYTVPGVEGALVDISLVWRNKTATRLAESTWLSFVPRAAAANASWRIDVLGYPVDPLDVVERGTRYKHAAWDGAVLQDGPHALELRTLDTALIAPGDIHHLLRYSSRGERPDPINGGMHANLHNNLWGTAFPQWYGDDGIARFQLIRRPQDASRPAEAYV